MRDKGSRFSRRKFLGVGLGVAAGGAALVPILSEMGPGGREKRLSPEELNQERLLPLGGRKVRVLSDNGVQLASLKVRGVSSVSSYSYPGADGEVFSVDFEGPPNSPLDQGTYEVSDSKLGTFPLFIVPVGPVEGHLQSYQAVFNRLV